MNQSYKDIFDKFTLKNDGHIRKQQELFDAQKDLVSYAEAVIYAFIDKASELVPGFEGIELVDMDYAGHNEDLGEMQLEITGTDCEYGTIDMLTEFPEDQGTPSPFTDQELAAAQVAAELIFEINGDRSW